MKKIVEERPGVVQGTAVASSLAAGTSISIFIWFVHRNGPFRYYTVLTTRWSVRYIRRRPQGYLCRTCRYTIMALC